jgi:hypothetical protein
MFDESISDEVVRIRGALLLRAVSEALDNLERKGASDELGGDSRTCVRDGAAEGTKRFLRDMAMAAHDGAMPRDIVWDAVAHMLAGAQEALEYERYGDDLDDAMCESASSWSDSIHNHLFIGSFPSAEWYLDEAMREGANTNSERFAAAKVLAARFVWDAMLPHLERRARWHDDNDSWEAQEVGS